MSTLSSEEIDARRKDDAELQVALAKVRGFVPIDEDAPLWKFSDHILIRVYRINGRFDLISCARAVWRRPVRHKGKWCIRDHGLVPLRGKLEDLTYVT
jgi:hypothetical protein